MMRHEPLLSLQEELREFVMQTQDKLTAVRKLMAHMQPANSKSSIGDGDLLPRHVSPHGGTLIRDTIEHDEFEASPLATSTLCALVPEVATTSPLDASELSPTSTATQRLEAIKRRLNEQIEKN